MRVHVDDSIRTNRLLVAVLAVGLVAVLFALPQPVAGATQGLGASAPTSLGAGVRSAFPPSPTQSGESSVDAILVFVNDSGSPSYSFRGHSPAVPLPVDAPLVWSWFSGNPGSPNVTGPAAPLDTSGLTTQARVAFSREGYAVAVWDSQSIYGTRICPGAAVPTNVTKSDIRFSIFQDATGNWNPPTVAAAAPANLSNPIYDEGFTRPVIAIDNNGNGLLAFSYRQTDPCTTGGGTRQIRYSVWNGTGQTFGPDALLAASSAPPTFDVDPMAIAFSSHLVVGDAITRQDGVVTWWDAVAPANTTCPSGPVSVPLAWPRYAIWDGNGFVQIDTVPGQRPAVAGYFESLEVRSGMGASPDQRGHVGVVFPVTTVTDPCTGAGLSHEVWRAIWNATTNSWQNGTPVDDGGNPAIAYGAEAGGDRGRMVYQGPEPPPGGGVDPTINRSLLNGTDIAPVGQVDAATGYSPTIAQLATDTALVVWADGSGFLRFWQRIGGVPPSESTGDVNAAGGVPFLAARTGSPQIPLAEWTYLQYMAHDQIPSNMTATVLDRLQSAGSTNLVNLAILLDAGGNPSHATDFYVKRLGRTALQDHGELNMGDQTTLEEFIARTVERYPARGEYILALDDHGNGWRGACSDNHPTTGDWLEPSELRGALTSANLTFQLALFNGCLMANVETAYQVEGFVRFLIASQEAMPLSIGTQGMRYDQFLGRLIEDPFVAAADPMTFSSSIVADYGTANLGLRDYTLSSIDVANVPAVVNAIAAFRNLGVPMIDQPNFNQTVYDHLRTDRNNAQAMRADSGVRDLFHFFSLVRDDATLAQSIRDAARSVTDWESLVVRANWSEPGVKSNARGLNIWFESSRVMYNMDQTAYAATRFAAAWQDVVRLLSSRTRETSRGILFSLQSSNPDVFLRVQDVDGRQVGWYSTTETCGGFSNSQIPNAGYSKLGGSITIFLPMWTTPIDWVVDGALITENVSYSLSIQEVTIDPGMGNTVVLFTKNASASVAPQQVVTGRFRPDTTAPLTTASMGGTFGHNSWWLSTVTVTLTVNETGDGVRNTSYRVDGGPYSVYMAPFTVGGDGSHLLEYFSTDVVGNVEPVQSETIQIDTVAPTVTRATSCSQPGDAGWCHGSVLVTLSSVDATSGPDRIEAALDNTTLKPYTGPQLVAGDGAHTLVYFAEDKAGNPSAIVYVTVPIDGTLPTITVNPVGRMGNAGWYQSNVTVTSKATDGTSGVAFQTIRIGTGGAVPYAGPVVIDTDGNFLMEIVAIDAAGNRASSVTQIKIDRTPPSFSLVLPNAPGNPITSSSLSIQVNQVTDSTSGIAGCSVALDGGASTALGSGFSYRLSDLEDGPHTVVASCSDNAGNVGSKSADFTVNTNLLSPQGPYGPIPLSGIVAAIGAIAVLGALLAWKRRRRALFALSHRKPARIPPPPKGGKRGF